MGAFGYGYYTSLSRNIVDEPKPKSRTLVENISNLPPYIEEKEVGLTSEEDIVTPSTMLEMKIVSINTGNSVTEYNDVVPNVLVNMNEDEVREYFKYQGSVEFSKDKITVTRELPYLPDCFVVKLENKYIVVYKTDADGNATRYEEFEPLPQKNRDSTLEKGIEVKTIEEVWEKIQDYE